MPIRVTCPNCEVAANIEEQSLGKRGRCKKCGHVFALARPDGGAASAVSGDPSGWKQGSSQPSSPTNLPEQFGRYRIMKRLGQGGMGAVYLAYDTKLGREVALKVPYFSPAEGPQAVQRFEREARAAATLDHPNLCPIHDVGEIDGIHYLTMPYIQGKTLSEAMGHEQTLTETQAAAIALKLAQALQEAHDKGIIHRDLKPGNIMVNRRRELIVMDFGLARMANDDKKTITQSGKVMGTAVYMAPEQASGDLSAIGPACDVYSLGVILYELLTGRPPFEGPWGLVIGLKNVKDPDPPSKHRPELNPILDALCHKAIAREPKDRYALMSELAEALEVFLISASNPELTSSGKIDPNKKPESLASQIFAGIVTREVTSLRSKTRISLTDKKHTEGSTPRGLRRPWIIAAVATATVLLLCVIIYVTTYKGRIKIEVNDPKAVAKIDIESGSETTPGFTQSKGAKPASGEILEDKLAKQENNAPGSANSPISVPGLWLHSGGRAVNAERLFLANGDIEMNGKVVGSWIANGRRMVIRWPNSDAPSGAWIDDVELSEKGDSYEGRGARGNYIQGKRVPMK